MKNGDKFHLPTIFIIFGATGDLAQRKLLPGLFALYQKKQLPELFQIVGFSRRDWGPKEYRAFVKEAIGKQAPDASAETLESFVKLCTYTQGLFQEREAYTKLGEILGRKDDEWQVCANKLFHLAVPPEFYGTIFTHLSESGLTDPCSPEEGWTRVIVEKPFGKDYESAKELDERLGKLFREEQIYRIDHYLGKETVQNILAFRFSNSFLYPAWNTDWIERIRVRLLEKGGVGDRGGFYDGVGALRDVGQNHTLQLLALFTMENPGSFDAGAIRAQRAKTLQALQALDEEEIEKQTLRGQYEGYRGEKNVAEHSTTETYFRIETRLAKEKWQDVPLILESGKGMPESKVEIEVQFKHLEPCLCPEEGHTHNLLRYQVQPDEEITVAFWVKKPGPAMDIEERDFVFDYHEAYGEGLHVDAYERLLLDAVRGDQTLFVSTEEILAGWRFVDPIIRAWEQDKTPLVSYEPQSADILQHPLGNNTVS